MSLRGVFLKAKVSFATHAAVASILLVASVEPLLAASLFAAHAASSSIPVLFREFVLHGPSAKLLDASRFGTRSMLGIEATQAEAPSLVVALLAVQGIFPSFIALATLFEGVSSS